MSRAHILFPILFALFCVADVRATEEELPPGAVARLGTLRFYHGTTIGAVAVSPGGKLVASGTLGHYQPLDLALGVTEFISDGRIVLWDAANGRKIRELEAVTGWGICRLAFSPNGKVLAACDGPGRRVGWWDVETGKRRATLLAPACAVIDVDFDACGRLLLCDDEHGWTAWDTVTGKVVQRWSPWVGPRPKLPNGEYAENCTFSRLSPDGKVLTFGIERYQLTEAGHIRKLERRIPLLVDAATHKTIAQFDSDYPFGVTQAAFTADGKVFATNDGHFQIWETATRRKLRDVPGNHNCFIYGLTVSPDAALIAGVEIVNMDRHGDGYWAEVHLWDGNNGKLLLSSPAFNADDTFPELSPLAFTPNGKTLISGHLHRLRRSDARTGREQLEEPGHGEPVTRLQFAADGRTLLTESEFAFCCWDFRGRQLRRWDKSSQPEGKSRILAASCDGQCVLEDKDGIVQLSKADDPKPKWKWLVSKVKYAQFAPHGRSILLVAHIDNQDVLYIRDVADGRPYCRVAIASVNEWPCFSPDGSRVAVATDDGVQLLDATNGEKLTTLRAVLAKQKWGLGDVAFSPNGQFLVAATQPIQDNAFGQLILSPAAVAVVFDVETGREIGRVTRMVPENDDLASHSFMSLAVSSDGRFLATSQFGETAVRVWELASGQERGRFVGHLETVRAVAFSPDGRSLLSGSDDGTVLVWNFNGPISQRKRAKSLTSRDAATLWNDLAGYGGTRVDDAVWALARSPDAGLPLLREKLPPAKVPSPEMLKRLLAQLDHDDFALRQVAARELQAFQEPATPALQAALKATHSVEVRRALEQVLESFADKSPETLRRVRAVEVLERIGTPDARKLLDSLADGVPEARLTREAQAAMQRLKLFAER